MSSLTRTVLCSLFPSVLLLLNGCDKTEEPIQATPLPPLPVDPEIQSVTRQMTQVETERRSLHQELESESHPAEQVSPPSEEQMRQAGQIIREHYQEIGRMPTRPEMVTLLTSKMALGTPQEAPHKASAILDMMMLD